MSKASKLTAERLRELLSYDPLTGIFTNRTRRSPTAPAGAVAGCDNGNGYIKIDIDGVAHHAHRLAWLYVHRVFPEGRLDHRDLNRSNNRIANLRPATPQQNTANSPVRTNNSTGYKGVTLSLSRKRYHARICINGKTKFLGSSPDPLVAYQMYLDAAREAFGEFAHK